MGITEQDLRFEGSIDYRKIEVSWLGRRFSSNPFPTPIMNRAIALIDGIHSCPCLQFASLQIFTILK